MKIADHKKQLRKQLRYKRQSLSDEQRQSFSTQICHHLLNTFSSLFCTSPPQDKAFAAYFSSAEEVSLNALFNHCWINQLTITAPVVNIETSTMEFFPVNADTQLEAKVFGILEPVIDSRPAITPQELTAIFVPLLGFDTNGVRLGMGGGFYDRYLARYENGSSKRPWLIACAFEAQKIDSIQCEPWDITMDAVVTEKKVYWCHESLKSLML